MEQRAELFQRKLEEYGRLISHASRRYSIPGVLDPEDLYQEGLIILDGMFDKYDFHPDSEDFSKMFKTELWHGLWHVLHRCKAQKRDWKKLVNIQDLNLEEDESSIDYIVAVPVLDPEEKLRLQQKQENVTDFVETLLLRIDDISKNVLNELLNTTWEEIPDYMKFTASGLPYLSIEYRSMIPNHIIAELLDIPVSHVRRSIKRIRREAIELAKELGLDKMSKAQVSRR